MIDEKKRDAKELVGVKAQFKKARSADHAAEKVVGLREALTTLPLRRGEKV